MKDSNSLLSTFKNEVVKDILGQYNRSIKKNFEYLVKNSNLELLSNRSKCILLAIEYLMSEPLNDNDYFKYLNTYFIEGIKLNIKYFRHNIEKLNTYYKKIDELKTTEKSINIFNKTNFENYVIFMFLKLYGHYLESDDKLFNVQIIDFREYNPLSKIPSVLRGCLPFEVKEYDIKRAFPTFIDIELNTEFRDTVYELIDKSNFAMYLNSNSESKVSIEEARKGLFPIYKERVNEVVTDERYKEKGKVFKDLTKYEKQYVERFVLENNLFNYARLHDGIFVLKDVECKKVEFETVQFTIKETIKPKIENEIHSFYKINKFNKVETSPVLYADFLKQEKFIRVSTPDDKIQILKNSNNVVDFFNFKTDMVSFLENEINELNKKDIRDKLAKDNNNVLNQSYTLLEPIKLEYYKDNKEYFGLPFKNGFFYFDDKKQFEIKSKNYNDVIGFFTPHPIQKREFSYTDEVGNFELFIQRISTGFKDFDKSNEEQTKIINSFNSMIGYLCHNYKPFDSPCIVLTDEGANDENRNGRRGKSMIWNAIQFVTKIMQKGGIEFDPNYTFCFSDLDKSYNLYVIDDVPCNFNFNSLYTQITGGINAQKKGSKAEMIEREDSPKFLITSNYLFRCDVNDASTVARFCEFKVKPYYHVNFSPKDEFQQTFFEDWNETEWNKFYSYIFRSVNYYLVNGLERIYYDKTEDNFKANFGSDAKLQEMERIINFILIEQKSKSFSVRDFLTIYNSFDNPLKFEKFFTHNNCKKMINIFLINSKIKNWIYNESSRKWFITNE